VSAATQGLGNGDATQALVTNAISVETGRNFRTVAKALQEVQPDGKIGRHAAWFLETAIEALGGRRVSGAGERLFDGLERAANAVDHGLRRMRRERSLEKRREIVAEIGASLGLRRGIAQLGIPERIDRVTETRSSGLGRCQSLSHGENRGSSPLGSASEIKYILKMWPFVSNECPINICGQAWTPRWNIVPIRAVARLRNRTDISCGLKVLAGQRPALLE